jgi:carboxypeptidase T
MRKYLVMAGCLSSLLLAASVFSTASLAKNGPAQLPIATIDPSLQIGPEEQQVTPNQSIYRVYFADEAGKQALVDSGLDLVEARGLDYLLVVGDPTVANKLTGQGFRVELDGEVEGLRSAVGENPETNTFYSGYRTVAEHEAHLDAVVASYPTLAKVVDFGDSWRKVNGIAGGHDLKAICITANVATNCVQSTANAKPRFFLIAAIHARELSTAETAYRFIDLLTQNYATDPEVATVVDHNEIWIVPVLNPDGRVIVQSGGNSPYLQRKNANNTQGSCSNPPTSSNQSGVDLNRNSDFRWGGVGASTAPCDQTFRGASASSEPEVYFLQNLVASLFPDQRGPNDADAAPDSATGTFISLHSYSNLVLLPWGWTTSPQAPNDAGLRALAFRMSYYNNYQTGTGPEILYSTSGTTDDWTYGTLGIASFTYEIGPASGTCSGFTPAYSCQDSTFWPLNRGALLYAAKTAREPYRQSRGPNSENLSVSAATVAPGTAVTLGALVDDNRSGNASGSFGRPAAQTVDAAEYYVDTPPWAGGSPIAMSASDGAFNASNENVTASINTSGWNLGRHTVYVRGRDAAGNWGPVSAIWITISNVVQPQAIAPVADAEVRGGTSANSNFGTATTIRVRSSSNASNTRWVYFKFDTSGVAGTLSNVKLRVYGSNSSNGTLSIGAYSASNTTWSETGITWNNRPTTGASALNSVSVASTSAAFYELDVTAYVNAERAAGRNTVTLVLRSASNTTPSFGVASRENTVNPARLVLTP